MTENVQAPKQGERLQASWGRSVTDAVNAMRATASPGNMVREGATGFSFEPVPQNLRDKRRNLRDRGCFYIKSSLSQAAEDGGENLIKITFGAPYFAIAGRYYRLSDEKAKAEFYGRQILAIRFSSSNGSDCSIATYENFVALENDVTENEDYYAIPLYEIDEAGAVAVDFRNIPTAVQGELSPGDYPQ